MTPWATAHGDLDASDALSRLTEVSADGYVGRRLAWLSG